MALVNCPLCGKEVDEELELCPFCGMRLKKKTESKVIEEITESADLSGQEMDLEREDHEIVQIGSFKFEKKKFIIGVAAIGIIIMILAGVLISQNMLFGDDKIAYDLIVNVATKFKNPASVRLVSGSVGTDKDCMFAKISATNGFGARSNGYYFISNEGWIMEDEEYSSYLILYNNESLNIDNINKNLAKTLKKYD